MSLVSSSSKDSRGLQFFEMQLGRFARMVCFPFMPLVAATDVLKWKAADQTIGLAEAFCAAPYNT